MIESKHPLYKSFVYAVEGLLTAITKGRNFRIQLFAGLLAATLGLILGLSPFEWLALIIIVSFILILELINTSLEAIVDLVSPEIQGKAKIAKDVAAAAVLISSLASILAGFILFLPKILQGI